MGVKRAHVHFRVRCACNAVVADCGHHPPMTHLLSPCLCTKTPRELFDFIVEKKCSWQGEWTELEPWFGVVMERICKAWKKHPDQLYSEIKSAVAEKQPGAAALMPGPMA